MRVRCTGLGRTEMELKQESLTTREGYLLLSLRSTEPVHWHIRILIERRDIGRPLLSVLNGLLPRFWDFKIIHWTGFGTPLKSISS